MSKPTFFITIVVLLVIIPALSFGFFCPNNFQQIQIGDSVEKVVSICGKPDTQVVSKRINENVPQEWTFFVPQAVELGPFSAYRTAGTLRVTVSFDAQGRAINISVNGIGVGATAICGGAFELGDSREKVRATCGTPSFVNKAVPATGGASQDISVIEMNYSSTPPVSLIFENGELVRRELH